MGREVRMVPADWQHPQRIDGNYEPLLDFSFTEQLAEWYKNHEMYRDGYIHKYPDGWVKITDDDYVYNNEFEDEFGDKPIKSDYMPEWNDDEKTHYQMYETCTEGTPISPPMATPEELAQWLVDNDASSFAHFTATYDQWMACIKSDYTPSAVIVNGEIKSGVEYYGKTD